MYKDPKSTIQERLSGEKNKRNVPSKEGLLHYFKFVSEIFILEDVENEDEYFETKSITNSKSKDCEMTIHAKCKSESEENIESDNELIK